MKQALAKVFGDPQARTIKRLTKKIASVNALATKYHDMNKTDLRKQTDVLKERLSKKNTTLDDIMAEAFAVVREMSDRTLGQRHYDVQLVAGLAMHEGNVAEMKTGEGKTLMATAPVYLNALTGLGVHVVTVNDYLAQRDTGWMGELYFALGLSTGCIINDQSFIFDPNSTILITLTHA
jgi:preprotein translocase subunit SecA